MTIRFADHLLTGDHASRPAATAVPAGTLYSCITHALIYQSSGSAWSTYATLGGTAVTDATITTTDVTTNNVSTSKHGWAPKADGNAAHYLDGTGAYSTPAGGGGGGGSSFPTLVQMKTAGASATSITLDDAPASGNSIILFLNGFNTAQATAVSSTNTTWTQVKTLNTAGGGKQAIWVGVASGSAGTAISVTHTNSFMSIVAVELDVTLTPTLGQSASSSTLGLIGMAAATAGNLVVVAAGADNTAQDQRIHPSVPSVGLFQSTTNTAELAAFFSQGGRSYLEWAGGAGGAMIAEIT